MVLPDINITEVQFPAPFPEAEVHLVKFIELLCGAIGLYGNIIIGDGGLYFNAVAEHTTQLQVESGVEHGILAVAKTDLPAEAAFSFQGAKIKGAPLLPGKAIVEFKRFYIEFADDTVITEALGAGAETKGKYPVGDQYTVSNGSFFPVQFGIYIIKPVIGAGYIGNGERRGHDAYGIKQETVGIYLENPLAKVRLAIIG